MKKIIIGGGVSGLVCAVLSARCGHNVTVLEADSRIGKKIAASGNGRCNLDNIGVNASCYNDSKIVANIFDKVTVGQCLDFWHSIGIMTYNDQHGRVYPLTDNSHTVVDCLRYACNRLGVAIECDCKVTAVSYDKAKYKVSTANGTTYVADEVVIACGSNSQVKIAQHSSFVPSQYFTKLSPSLTPIMTTKPESAINGIRTKCKAQLLDSKGQQLAESCGEVLFRDYGLSGICIMDLSATIARRQAKGIADKYKIVLDVLPDVNHSDLTKEILHRIKCGYGKEQLFYGILHNKLADVICRRCNINKTLDKNSADMLSKEIKHFSFEVDKLCGFQYSQVTSGGIDEQFVDQSMRLPNGLYALGEILDVDGLCGGYNIHFATASAIYYCIMRDGKIYE